MTSCGDERVVSKTSLSKVPQTHSNVLLHALDIRAFRNGRYHALGEPTDRNVCWRRTVILRDLGTVGVGEEERLALTYLTK